MKLYNNARSSTSMDHVLVAASSMPSRPIISFILRVGEVADVWMEL